MPAYGPGRSNYTPEASGPTTQPEILWTVSTSTTLSAPVLDDGTVYVGGDDGTVRALDARTGADSWQKTVGERAGTPQLLDGQVYVPTDTGITVLNATDSSQMWTVDAPDREGLLVASHGAYYISNGEPPSVVSIALDTGEERWKTEVAEPWTKYLFATADYLFVSADTLSNMPWIMTTDTGTPVRDQQRREIEDGIGARFVLDGTVFSHDPMFGEFQANRITETDYTTLWRQRLDAYGPSLAGGTDHLYFAGGSGLYALSRDDGTTAWRLEEKWDQIAGRPAVARDAVVIVADDSLRCFDPANGTERWRRSAEDIGPQIILAEDSLFTSNGGRVTALRSM